MALFHITIEKVIVESDNHEIKKLLHEILKKIGDNEQDEELRKQIMHKLEVLITDVKSTI